MLSISQISLEKELKTSGFFSFLQFNIFVFGSRLISLIWPSVFVRETGVEPEAMLRHQQIFRLNTDCLLLPGHYPWPALYTIPSCDKNNTKNHTIWHLLQVIIRNISTVHRIKLSNNISTKKCFTVIKKNKNCNPFLPVIFLLVDNGKILITTFLPGGRL